MDAAVTLCPLRGCLDTWEEGLPGSRLNACCSVSRVPPGVTVVCRMAVRAPSAPPESACIFRDDPPGVHSEGCWG